MKFSSIKPTCKRTHHEIWHKDAKLSKTLMATTTKLDKDEQGINVNIKFYRGTIGSLIYLKARRSDIMFSVCLCARFQSCPKESHLIVV